MCFLEYTNSNSCLVSIQVAFSLEKLFLEVLSVQTTLHVIARNASSNLSALIRCSHLILTIDYKVSPISRLIFLFFGDEKLPECCGIINADHD